LNVDLVSHNLRNSALLLKKERRDFSTVAKREFMGSKRGGPAR
jgi:hypothetical protein